MTKEELIDSHELYFDAAEPRNASLYLCLPSGEDSAVLARQLIASLCAAGLWSAAPAKQVADEQRDAYKAGLELLELTRFVYKGQSLHIARCDHPKFPSDADRWAEWQHAVAAFDAGS